MASWMADGNVSRGVAHGRSGGKPLSDRKCALDPEERIKGTAGTGGTVVNDDEGVGAYEILLTSAATSGRLNLGELNVVGRSGCG